MVIAVISNNDETAYRKEVQQLAAWCTYKNLLPNTRKTKELIIDFRRERGSTHNPIHINGMAVERSWVPGDPHLGVLLLDY